MKNLKIILVALAFIGLSSCGDEDNVTYSGDAYAQFQVASASTGEDGEPITVDVSLATGENTSGETINFDLQILSGDASRFTIEPSNGSLTIPAGEFVGQIVVTPIDNDVLDGDVELQITLTDSGSLPGGINGADERSVAMLTIGDNDCIPPLPTLYNVDVFAFGFQAPSHEVEFVPVPGTSNQWTITSSWGPEFVAWATGNPGFSGAFPYSGTLTLNCDFTVDFIGDDSWGTGGTGTFNGTDTFELTLTQALFTSDFTVDIVLTGL